MYIVQGLGVRYLQSAGFRSTLRAEFRGVLCTVCNHNPPSFPKLLRISILLPGPVLVQYLPALAALLSMYLPPVPPCVIGSAFNVFSLRTYLCRH